MCVHLNLVDSSPDERRFLQLETKIVLMLLHFRAKEGEGLFVFFFPSPEHRNTSPVSLQTRPVVIPTRPFSVFFLCIIVLSSFLNLNWISKVCQTLQLPYLRIETPHDFFSLCKISCTKSNRKNYVGTGRWFFQFSRLEGVLFDLKVSIRILVFNWFPILLLLKVRLAVSI